MPKLSILLSTIDRRIYNASHLLNNKLPDTEVIVIHQITEKENIDVYENYYGRFDKEKVKFLQRFESGTGKSRNLALEAACGELFFICDDDIQLTHDFFEVILRNTENFSDADIFTFMIKDEMDKPYKNYPDKIKLHTIRSVATVSNVEIIIRKEWHDKAKIKFDERFGLGTKYNTGEEFVFLSDAIRNGAKAIFIPEYICIHPKESSGKKYSAELIKAKGAMIARVYGYGFSIYNLAFAIKKFPEYKSKISLFRFIKLIYLGSFQFLKND